MARVYISVPDQPCCPLRCWRGAQAELREWHSSGYRDGDEPPRQGFRGHCGKGRGRSPRMWPSRDYKNFLFCQEEATRNLRQCR